jgi:hypothetical protein
MLFAFLGAHCKAQYLDTLHEVFRHKSSMDARIESRYSFINNELSSVTGLRLGVAFQRKLRIGGGISWLKTDHQITFNPQTKFGQRDTLNRFLKFGYLCFYIDFVFYRTKRWQLSVPIQAGVGHLWFQRYKSYDFWGTPRKYMLALYEPGITAQFKIFQWLGLGSDIAYRFTLNNDKKIRQQFDNPASKYNALPWTPTYSFKLLIWFDHLYYVLLPESKITKRFGPAFW